VLRAGSQFWQGHSESREEAAKIAETALASLSTVDEFDRQEALEVLTDAHAVFKKAATTL
jgi:hypothetical protein